MMNLFGPKVPEIDVQTLKEMMDSGESFVLLDVRDPDEFEQMNIPGAVLLPLGELQDRVGELDPQAKTVVMCLSGGRSARATEFLMKQGFRDVCNLKGGILAWQQLQQNP